MNSNTIPLGALYWGSHAVSVAATLGIADLLRDGPKSCAELAQATRTHASSLYRVMRALACIGVFAESDDGRFSLNPAAECLQAKAPGSIRDAAIMLGQEWHWRAWGDVLHSVRTGQCAFEHVFGMELFEYFEQHPAAAAIFNDAMTSLTSQQQDAVVSSYNFSGISKIVDVGGGHGTLLASILKAHPGMSGILFDLPSVVAGARQRIQTDGLIGRCEVVGGDFFQSVPEGGDGYLLKQILHDWDDDHAVAILKNCRPGIGQTGKLLVVEMVIPPGNAPSMAKLLDLLMLVWTHGGRERTEAEYRALFAAAGFALARNVPTPSPLSVLEARLA
jgi:O-methyltransferase